MTTRVESLNREALSKPDTSPGGADESAADRERRRLEALEYVRSMLGELNDIARHQRFDMIAYLLEMACVEAADAMARETTSRRRRTSRV
jgi:hypothetical protein